MAYQNVNTPRFYIDHLQYLTAEGLGFPQEDVFGLQSVASRYHGYDGSPTYAEFGWGFSPDSEDPQYYLNFPDVEYGKLNYMAILNHNFAFNNVSSLDCNFRTRTSYPGETNRLNLLNPSEIVNTDFYYDGYSIWEFDDFNFTGINLFVSIAWDNIGYWDRILMGGISIGCMYTPPINPRLNMTLEHDYSGTTSQTSMSGATLTNQDWKGPPNWQNGGLSSNAGAEGFAAWRLGSEPMMHTGRREWKLSWTHLGEDLLEPKNLTGWNAIDENRGVDNWFQNVLHYTRGGELPFIFCPDSSITYDHNSSRINSIPEFAICRFDKNDFSRKQVAPRVYDMSIKIVEHW